MAAIRVNGNEITAKTDEILQSRTNYAQFVMISAVQCIGKLRKACHLS